MLVKCFHSGRIIYKPYWLVVLAYLTFMIILKGCGTAIALEIAWMRNSPGANQMSYILILQSLVQQIINSHFLDQALRFWVHSSLVNCTENVLSLASLKMTEEIINQIFASKIYYCNRFLVNPELWLSQVFMYVSHIIQ